MPRVAPTRVHAEAPQIPPVSPEIVIMTRAELLAIQRAEFNAGIEAARLLPHAPVATVRGKLVRVFPPKRSG